MKENESILVEDSEGRKYHVPPRTFHIGKADVPARVLAAGAFLFSGLGVAAGVIYDTATRRPVEPSTGIVRTVKAMETQEVSQSNADCGVMDVYGPQIGLPVLNATECPAVRETLAVEFANQPTPTLLETATP